MFLRHPDSRIFHIHIQSGASSYTPATPINSQKSTKAAVSHPASPYAVAMPHRSPCGPYSHTVSLTQRSPRPARVLAGLQSIHDGSSRQLTSYPPRPARPVHSNAHPANLLKFPAPARGAWRRFAMRRRQRRSRGLHSSPSEGGLLRRGSQGNRGRLDPAKVRRCGARAIGSAGRMTDRAGHRLGPASRLRYAVGVPCLYLFVTVHPILFVKPSTFPLSVGD